MIRYAMLACIGLLSVTPPAHAQPRTAESVIHNLSSALLSRDAARTLQLFDLANGGYAYSFDGRLTAGPKFEAWLRRDILETGRVFIIDKISSRAADIHVEATYGIGRPQDRRFYLFRLSPDGRINEWRISHSPATQ